MEMENQLNIVKESLQTCETLKIIQLNEIEQELKQSRNTLQQINIELRNVQYQMDNMKTDPNSVNTSIDHSINFDNINLHLSNIPS